jgi:hypothetical protein
MVQKQKSPERSKPAKAAAPAPKAEAPVVKAKEDVAPESVAEAVSNPTVIATALSTVVIPPHHGDAGDETTITFDFSELPIRTLDYFAENAFAFFEHAADLSKAASLTEVVELQSNFATERYSTFFKQIESASEIFNHLAKGAGFSIRQNFGLFAA